MSDREVNIPLLRKAVEWAEAEDASGSSHWMQDSWVYDIDVMLALSSYSAREIIIKGLEASGKATCGTVYCIAGYVAQLVDPRLKHTGRLVDEEEDRIVTSADTARDALGLSEAEARLLFHGDNTIEDVRRIAEQIAGEPL